MKQIKQLFLLSLVIVLLAACAAAPIQNLPDSPNTDATEPTGDPIKETSEVLHGEDLSIKTPGDNFDIIETPRKFSPLVDDLTEQLNIRASQIFFLDAVEHTFTNGCLNLEKPGEMCTAVMVPGYIVTFETPNGIYTYHANEVVSQFGLQDTKQISVEAHELGAIFVWQRSGGIAGICLELTVFPKGTYLLEDCASGKQSHKGQLPEVEMLRIEKLVNDYQAFTWTNVIPAGAADMFSDSLTIYGVGTKTFPAAEYEVLHSDFADMVYTIQNGTLTK